MKRLKELTDKDFEDIKEIEFITRVFDYVADENDVELKMAYSVVEAIKKLKSLCKGGKNIAGLLSYDTMGLMDNNEIIIRYIDIEENSTDNYNIYDKIDSLIQIEVDDYDIMDSVLELGRGTIYGRVYLSAINGKIYADEQLYYTYKMLSEESSLKVICKKTYSYIGIIPLIDLKSKKISSLDIKLFNACTIRDCRIRNLSVKQLSNSILNIIQCKIDELTIICGDYDSGITLNSCEIDTLIIDTTNVKNRDKRVGLYSLIYDNSNNIKETKVTISRRIYEEVYGGRIIINNNKELEEIIALPKGLKVNEINIKN